MAHSLTDCLTVKVSMTIMANTIKTVAPDIYVALQQLKVDYFAWTDNLQHLEHFSILSCFNLNVSII